MPPLTRRRFLQGTVAGLAASRLGGMALPAQVPGERPRQDAAVRVLNPRMRVPLSFIIDDSTCLVNLNRFAIPQFAEAWNYQRYEQDWRSMRPEIPDDFVRKFGNWCGEQGVKGKYSIVPYPACVGRVDRVLPGWSRKELDASLELVRTLMLPNWDIHPEMVTHTIAIDTKTGQPFRNPTPMQMENWQFTDGKSVDELATYLAYALKILKNVGLPCEGVTTPGGFAGRVKPELAQAAMQSIRDVFGTEIPHYFKYLIDSGPESVEPRVEYVSGLDGSDPRCVVSIIACTGDWTGGWDCSDRGDVDRFITADLRSGRMVKVVDRGEPAVMRCHWTGIYFNGEEVGFQVFQEAVRRLNARYDDLRWMTLSQIARYWAAKTLTTITRDGATVTLTAPYACPDFTIRVPARTGTPPALSVAGQTYMLKAVTDARRLEAGTWLEDDDGYVACFDLQRGTSSLLTGG